MKRLLPALLAAILTGCGGTSVSVTTAPTLAVSPSIVIQTGRPTAKASPSATATPKPVRAVLGSRRDVVNAIRDYGMDCAVDQADDGRPALTCGIPDQSVLLQLIGAYANADDLEEMYLTVVQSKIGSQKTNDAAVAIMAIMESFAPGAGDLASREIVSATDKLDNQQFGEYWLDIKSLPTTDQTAIRLYGLLQQ